MDIKYKDVCHTDFLIRDIAAYKHKDASVYDYTQSGRVKHVVFYLCGHERSYYVDGKHVITLKLGDIIVIPHGAKYKSVVENKTEVAKGLGVSFNLVTPEGENVFFDEEMRVFRGDTYNKCHKRFERILFSAINANKNVLKLKSEMYTLLEELFSEKVGFSERYGDISDAINLIEKHPENNSSVKELADICHMSESTFMRKFKDYSGGVTPIKYRNNIRLMMAEELSASLSLGEIAEKLGFYDGAHLCKIYKQTKGYTLKNREIY